MKEKEYKFCLRCGRRLRNEETRRKGFGAVCEKKMLVEQKKKLF